MKINPKMQGQQVVTQRLSLSSISKKAVNQTKIDKKQKLAPLPQPLPNCGAVPQDEIINKDQT